MGLPYGSTSDHPGRMEDELWQTLEPALPLVYVAELDRAGTIRYISEVVRDWTGHAPEEFIADGQLWYTCIHPGDVGRVRAAEQRYFDTKEQLDLEYRLIGPDGEPRWVWERNTIVRDGDGQPLCTHGTVVDLSRFGARALSETIIDGHAALVLRHNFLTGLPTRHVLPEHLKLALARARRSGHAVALLDIDMDRFRGVNDAVGHAVGDLVLMHVARRIAGAIDPGDLLVYSGGDEFLLLLCDLPDATAEEAVERISQRIDLALSGPFEAAGQQLHLRASIGYAIGPQDGEDADTLHNAAHAAVTAAKRAGRGLWRRYQPDAAQALRRRSVDYRLRRAIEQDEVIAYYQPIVELPSGRMVAAEALVRWQLESGEVLGAGEVVPPAEESSLILDLDVHMLRLVCAQARAWRDQGRELKTHVNVSSRLVRWRGFQRAVLQAIDEAGIEPSDLVLELTETNEALVDDGVDALLELRQLGIELTLDDFGAGYSSLARLRMVPVSSVKLDRQLLLAAAGEMPPEMRVGPASATPEAGQAVVSALLRLGDTVGVEVVVEGVETAEVRDLMVQLGATGAQGYFFGRPQPPEKFLAELDARER